jgi:putative DNA primase/helicase
MSDFLSFVAAHGLIIDHLEQGRWVRVRTEDKPRKKNGSYKYLGDVGWVQNHATMLAGPAMWRRDEGKVVDRIAYARQMADKRAADARAEAARHARASEQARGIMAECASAPHPYLEAKGFGSHTALVHPGGDLIVAMREFTDYSRINGVQRISADGSKLFLPGSKAKGSVFIMGRGGRQRWLVEGFATGLSVHRALMDLRRSAEVIVCFSAGNLRHVAGLVRRPAFVMADNDESGAGQEAAEATRLPWVRPPDVGDDANDMMLRHGLRALVQLVASASELRVIQGAA